MTWILLMMISYNGGGFTAEFSSRERCESAGSSVVAMFDAAHPHASKSRRFVCVEK